MDFYLFDKEEGFEYLALIYASDSNEAIKRYQEVVCYDNGEPKLIDNSLALEFICSSNLDDDEFDDVMSEIKESQNTRETVLVLVDSMLV